MASVSRPEPIEGVGMELVREWAPDAKPRAIIVLVHGLGEHSGRYERIGDQLADAGYFVRAFDLIGFGGTGGRRADIDDWSRYHDQIQGHMEWAKGQGAPVVLFGFSMGGNLALGYTLEERPGPDLLVLSAPALDGGAAWQKGIAPIAAKLAPTVRIPNGFKGEWFSRDPLVGEAYFADPLVETKSSTRLGNALFVAMTSVTQELDRLETPTLVLHGGLDPIVPPQSTAILGELEGVERRLLPDLRHEVFNEPEGPEVLGEVIAWIDARI
ncbi:MAG: lysophospholipase [Acidimicrobiia bacterium]